MNCEIKKKHKLKLIRVKSRNWFISLLLLIHYSSSAEVILQYFGTSWNEINRRIPELAEAGWTALWLPPPFKAGSTFSVGFDTYDRFDFGSKDQMGGVATRYGTEDDLIRLIETAHRFGIRVYFDNVMAHNGGSTPGYDENTSIYTQPGFVPEDFHLIRTPAGFYRRPPKGDYTDEWQVLNRNEFGLDIAQEDPNTSFGDYEGMSFPKYRGIRHPLRTDYYLDTDLPIATNGTGELVYTFADKEIFEDIGYGLNQIGSGNGKFDWDDSNNNGQHDVGEVCEPFSDTGLNSLRSDWKKPAFGWQDGIYNMGNPIEEDVNTLLFRAVRWFVDKAKPDGFRLDAVKHAPFYFFGKTDQPKDASNWGYCGQIQEQFNISRGYSDWSNHRDTVFSTDSGRDDAMLFGEHLGAPPPQGPYLAAGMRIADNSLLNTLNSAVSEFGSLNGHDQPGNYTYGVNEAVMYAGSHDFNYMSFFDRPSAHSLLLTRAGLPIIYTDGYNETLAPDSKGKFFPQHGNNPFLGQFNDNHLLNLLYINQLFARGEQQPRWSDDNYVAYERLDFRETSNEANATILSYLLARNGSGGQARSWQSSFPEGSRLRNYSDFGGNFFVNVVNGELKNDEGLNPIVPEGGFFAFSWQVPDVPQIWQSTNNVLMNPIEIIQDGQVVEKINHIRKDGYSGDPAFNPYDLEDDDVSDYSYDMPIPRITSASNITFQVRVDGSAEKMLIKFNGGVDLNSQLGIGPLGEDKRDYPPALNTDEFNGYEEIPLIYRSAEKFASKDVTRNKIGSLDAEIYQVNIGSPGSTVINGAGPDNLNDSIDWVFHDPSAFDENANLQFNPLPENAADSLIEIRVKVGYEDNADLVHLYYTTNGVSDPQGSCGIGNAQTQVINLQKETIGSADNKGLPEWWIGYIPAMPSGTLIKYKIGARAIDEFSVFPFSQSDIDLKSSMESVFSVSNINLLTSSYYKHNDYGEKVSLEDGFHIIRAKPLLNRNNAASVYNLYNQTFYYDLERPKGEIVYPSNNGDNLNNSEYQFVVRTDATVNNVQFKITDSNIDNNDANTNTESGNASWVDANRVTSSSFIDSIYPLEWRFDYINVPSSGNALIEVRLKEASSSTNNLLNDVEGHFTTLSRSVSTSGPDVKFFVGWPNLDGQTVGPEYIAKVYFSKNLGNGLNFDELLDAFTVYIDGVARPRSDYQINYNISEAYHELAFEMGNHYNTINEYLHNLTVQFNREDYPQLIARRTFYSWPVAEPYLNIVSPPIADENGEPFRLILPDIANPTTNDRQFNIYIETDENVVNLELEIDPEGNQLSENISNPIVTNNFLGWNYNLNFPLTNLSSMVEGKYRLIANLNNDLDTNTYEKIAFRDFQVILREQVNISTNDLDNDDDGLYDSDELNIFSLPETPVTDWLNSDVHIFNAFGGTKNNSSDSDGDGLPDGLEVGWRIPLDTNQTDIAVDTDGDGFKNFISDYDPPFYNTYDNFGLVPGVSTYSEGDKTDLVAGSTTDPNNPDSDYDGILDGIEDANRDGWLAGDGEVILPNINPSLNRDWPDGIRDNSEVWTETDPNNADTDGDGLSDGYGEDTNFNGFIDGDVNSNRIFDAGEVWLECDPLNPDTDGDGLPDGWEVNYQLNPRDNGNDNIGTAQINDGLVQNGALGDPDQDLISNYEELLNGTNPSIYNSDEEPPEPSIVIGEQSPIIIGSVTNKRIFTDWNLSDLIALDYYDDLNEETNGGDVYYRAWESDGLESSRDLIAFYAQDGGSLTNNGDGNFYFRVDVLDLTAFAEDSGLDVYVVIDLGNVDIGEKKLVDNLDVLTDMRWEVVVAAYGRNDGTVYVNMPASSNTSSLDDSIIYNPTNVDVRTQTHSSGFKESFYDSKQDSIEFSINRNALIDAGWNGNFNQLNFQIFTTRDGTDGGLGELDGPDIHDSIRNNGISEDFAGLVGGSVEYDRYQNRISLDTLNEWVGVNADNNRGQKIHILPLLHGNEHIQPSSEITRLVNNSDLTGMYRALDAHEVYELPLNLHITPTLASALQWAKSYDGQSEYDGANFNKRIKSLITNGLAYLTGSTFSDHMMPYFNTSFNQDNISLANNFLNSIYGESNVSTSVFWTPERLLDHNVLSDILDAGFAYTFIDQTQHLYHWFDIDQTRGDNAYRINLINGIKCIPIADRIENLWLETFDYGIALELRKFLLDRALSGTWDNKHPQILALKIDWQEFNKKEVADGYDRLLNWINNKKWIQTISINDISKNLLDISVPPDGVVDEWKFVDRSYNSSLDKVGHTWIQHASQGSYDNWFFGSDLNEGLVNKNFEVIPGILVPYNYGNISNSIMENAWTSVSNLISQNSSLSDLARATLYASVFETGFHKNDNDDPNLIRFSSGEFVYPDTSYSSLSGFAKVAQGQTRMTQIYNSIDEWTRNPPVYVESKSMDIDMDGIDEFIICNNRVFIMIEAIGGRITGVWTRDSNSQKVYQVIGNFVSYSGSENEEEGENNIDQDGLIDSFRTSCLKDYFVNDNSNTNSSYVNDIYTASIISSSNGWSFISSDGKIKKSIIIENDSTDLDISYELSPSINVLYIRNGLSPDLYSLLLNGQESLSDIYARNQTFSIYNNQQEITGLAITLGTNAFINLDAVDYNENVYVRMRNQAHTEQVELYGSGKFNFKISTGISSVDNDSDGMPDSFEIGYDFLSNQNNQDSEIDYDNDGVSNLDEYISGTDMMNSLDLFKISHILNSNLASHIIIPTKQDRNYYLWRITDLIENESNQWELVNSNPIFGNNESQSIQYDSFHSNNFFKVEVTYP